MPIETLIDGDPASIRSTADWLRTTLAGGLDRSVTDMFTARDHADSGWGGDAGPAFSRKIDTAARRTDGVRADAASAAQSFHRYADDLTTAQSGMERARSIARNAGLELSGTTIYEPTAVPAVPALPADRVPTADMVAAHNESVTAYNGFQMKLAAYTEAQAEANRANTVLDAAKKVAQNMWGDITSKPVLLAGDFVNEGVIGGLTAKHASILKAQSKALFDESKVAAERYLTEPGGSAASKRLISESFEKFMESDSYALRAAKVGSLVESKIPVIGLVVTAADIGYDIHTGKPVGKAVISGVGGALAAAGTGALVGTMIAGPVGTVVGAGVGIVAGLVVSGGLDWGYDELPDGAKQAIEGGFDAVGQGVEDAGSAIGDGAKKAWNAIF
jgi:hypothetical protein